MIPKVIHLFWFGGSQKSNLILSLNKKLKLLENDGYQIIEWSESNYNVYEHEFTKKCYEEKKWAHLSDYARLDILLKYGGIYLDQDIEVIKSFNDLLDYKLFIGFMFECNLGTAVIGSEKDNKHITRILKKYDQGNISTTSPNNDLFTKYFLTDVLEFKLNGREQYVDDVKIFPKNYFEQPSLFNKLNYTIHHFDNSWRKKSKYKITYQFFLKKIIGLYLYRFFMCRKALKISPFYKEWKKYQ
ncbi:glycosyltransferase [uncultured Acinetobacter sp.]|uniref:glycosyltransferase family 32 protein n=1 Tax=uncultured Acinetobacter sp. TaxID=165433 RepID=UPI002588A440|nr:glycosyltransferase [uncultured Acinetobacter sp.]